MHIRAFATDDYDEVLALWRKCELTIKRSDTLTEIMKFLALPANGFFIASTTAARPEIVGSVIGAWDGRRGWIYHLAVAEPARRSGVGRQLMSAVEEHLRAQGAIKINLLVEPGNQAAADFYRAIGYSSQTLQFFTKSCD